METIDKEVHFDEWCPKCKCWKNKEEDEPCNECLSYPTNQYSHKPLRYSESSNEKHEV